MKQSAPDRRVNGVGGASSPESEKGPFDYGTGTEEA